jgi:hypothetical protein
VKALKVAGLLAMLYALCLIVAVGSVGATMALTEGLGAGRTSDVVMTLLVALAVLFLLSVVAAFFLQLWMRVGLLWNLLATGVYLAALSATYFLFALFSAVIFNR